jgi:hypothetical protein
MSGDSAVLQQPGIETSAIVTNANPKYPVIVSDLCFNPTGVRVPICIPQDLQRYATDLILRGGR